LVVTNISEEHITFTQI